MQPPISSPQAASLGVIGGTGTTSGYLAEVSTSNASFRFDELRSKPQTLGFEKRVKGSHHIFRKEGVDEMINLQRDGGTAKPYQVRQVRSILLRSNLVEKA